MDNDPKSYRVPILRLKDVLGDDGEKKDGDNTAPNKNAQNPRETTSETFPVQYIEEVSNTQNTPQVFEKDIESAIITPLIKEVPAVSEKVEQKKAPTKTEKVVPSTPPQKKEGLSQEPAKEKTPKDSEKKPALDKAIHEIKEKEVILQEPEKTFHKTHIEIEKENPVKTEIHISKPVQKIKKFFFSKKTEDIEKKTSEGEVQSPPLVKMEQVPLPTKPPLPTEIKIEPQKDFVNDSQTKVLESIPVVDKKEKPTEKNIIQPEKKILPDEKLSREKLVASMLEDGGEDSIFSLIEDTLESEEQAETAQIEEVPQPETFIEKVEIKRDPPRKSVPRIPVPDPLDIWEQDAAKPRVPYHPKKPVLPTPPVPTTPERSEGAEKIVVPVPKIPTIEEKKIDTPTLTVPVPTKNTDEPKGTEKPKEWFVPKPVAKVDVATPDIIEPTRKTETENKNAQEKENKTQIEVKEVIKEEAPQTPLQRLPAKEKTPKDSEKNPEKTKPVKDTFAGLSNLSSLRERVLKESQLHATSQIEGSKEGLAKKRQKDLVQTDLHALHAITKTIEKEKVPGEVDSKEQPQFASKHAQAVADIASRMHDRGAESKDPNATALENAVKLAEALEVDGDMATLPKNKVPGELGEAVPKPTYKTPESGVPMIRTFRQDVEQAVTHNRTSVVDMISAEQKRREDGEMFRQAPRQETSSWSYVFIGASMVLVIVSLVVGAFIFFRLATKAPSDIIPERIPVNETISYDTTSQTKKELMSGLVGVRDALHTSLGSITEVQLTERKNSDGESSGKTNFMTTSSFLQRIESRAPGNLIRSLNDSMLLGVHELAKNEAFLIFTALAYEESYSGMFEWESSMNNDLAPLFGTSLEAIAEAEYALLYKKVTVGTSTATTTDGAITEPKMPVTMPTAQFEDVFVSNMPVRGLKNKAGETVLMWSMPDEITIVITTNESTMRIILEYMASQRL